MLDEFSAIKVDPKKPAPPSTAEASQPKPEAAASGSSAEAKPEAEAALSEDDFAKQLQAGMADLLGELEKSVSFNTLPEVSFPC